MCLRLHSVHLFICVSFPIAEECIISNFFILFQWMVYARSTNDVFVSFPSRTGRNDSVVGILRRMRRVVEAAHAPRQLFKTLVVPRAAASGTPPSSEPPKPSASASTVPVVRSSVEIAAEESLNQQNQVDPFRIGYNMGMQTVHLETLRTKLDDNLELFKSHFHSLRESLRNNHESLRALQTEYNKQTRMQLDDGMNHLREKIDQFGVRLQTNEDVIRELSKQQFESMQKHFDDRLENIKDTIKLFVGLLLALNVWILFLVNQIAHQPHTSSATSFAAAHQHVVLPPTSKTIPPPLLSQSELNGASQQQQQHSTAGNSGKSGVLGFFKSSS